MSRKRRASNEKRHRNPTGHIRQGDHKVIIVRVARSVGASGRLTRPDLPSPKVVSFPSFSMTSSTNQHQSAPDGHTDEPSSLDRTEYKLNINGEVFHVTQLAKKMRQAAKKLAPFIPPSDGTPVNNLPNELLSYIFILGSEAEESDHDEDAEEDEEDEEDAPSEHRLYHPFKVLVSHVCRRWRVVVIEIPTLWAYLDFAEGPPFDKSRTWLERSKECPLDIELDCTAESESEAGSESEGSEDQGDSSSENELVASQDRVAMPGGPPLTPLRGKENKKLSSHLSPADLPVVRDLILPHSARWRVFELMVDDFQIMYGILSTLASIPEAPELRALRLYHYDDNEDFDHFSPAHLKQPFFAPFCGRAPKLSLVTLWGVHVDWEACAFLQGLEELELAYHARDVRPSYEIFIRILRGSPDLHNLTLSASGPASNPEAEAEAAAEGEEDHYWPADVIELPSVRQLVLAFVEPSYASALMKRLVFPNLQVLALDFDPDNYSRFVEQLASPAPKQRHSLCQNLVELKLSGMQCSGTALTALYAVLPNLLALELNCYHLEPPFFGYLFGMEFEEDGPKGYCLPKLTFLTTSGISGERMRHLVSHRPAIKHVRMDSKDDVEEEDENWLRANTESFDFFEGSDDEDDDASVLIVDLTDSGSEGDEVPEEWVDDEE